jgi:hypothetical protein
MIPPPQQHKTIRSGHKANHMILPPAPLTFLTWIVRSERRTGLVTLPTAPTHQDGGDMARIVKTGLPAQTHVPSSTRDGRPFRTPSWNS